MIRRCICIVLLFCLLLSGCSWMNGNYVSVTPHRNDASVVPNAVTTVSGYRGIINAIIHLVESGADSGVLSAEDYALDELEYDLKRACRDAIQNTSIGAYAVDLIEYEIGTGIGPLTVALSIQYRHGRNDIRQIRAVDTMQKAEEIIATELNQCSSSVTIRIFNYIETDFVQFIEDYYNRFPNYVIELPQVTVQIYPESGLDRIVEIQLSYQTSRDALREMQSYTQSVFSSAYLYVIGDTDPHVKYSQLFSFLMERYEYTIETSITPAYSLLRHGVGDSRAFAAVYARMCNSAYLECHVVSGTKSGEPYFWNIIQVDERYYHLDLLECAAGGTMHLLTDQQMVGYVWDYSSYPVCQ